MGIGDSVGRCHVEDHRAPALPARMCHCDCCHPPTWRLSKQAADAAPIMGGDAHDASSSRRQTRSDSGGHEGSSHELLSDGRGGSSHGPMRWLSWKLRMPNLRIQSGYEQQNRSKFQENRAVFTSMNFVDRVASIFWIMFWPKTFKWTLVFLDFLFQIFESFKFDQRFSGFYRFSRNQLVVDWYFNPCLLLLAAIASDASLSSLTRFDLSSQASRESTSFLLVDIDAGCS
jgi:hypothetical protein